MQQLNGKSKNIINENIEKLKELFPEVFSEGKIDFDKLKSELGSFVETKNERYNFTWNGKNKARHIALTPSVGTLRPCRNESKNWDTTQNLYIEGDNLEVLKLLQKSYYKKVKMIYIDPPYNTGKDFVYKDNFRDNIKNYLQITGQVDSEGNRLSTNSETNGRYHSDWLSMMYPRLKLARNLLKDDGVIFISIDDNEVANLRKLCDEIFGEDNFVADFTRVTKKAGKSSEQISKNHDTLLCYQKTDSLVLSAFEHDDSGFKFSDEFVEERGLYKLNQTLDYGSIQYSASLDYEIEFENKILRAGNVSKEEMIERQKRNPKSDFCWRWSKDLYEFGLKNGFVVVKEYDDYSRIYTKTYQKATISKNNSGYFVETKIRLKSISTLDLIDNKYSNDNSKKDLLKLFEKSIFDYSKPIELLKTLSFIGANNNDIILDFFSGSATTAHAVMKLNSEDGGNRKFICVQLPETTNEKSEAFKAGYKNICEIGKERIRRAGDKILNQVQNDNTCLQNDNVHQIQNDNARHSVLDTESQKKLDIGFKVFKLDSSNIKEWCVDCGDDLECVLKCQTNNIKEERSNEDLLYEILLKYGLDLTLPIEELNINGKNLFNVGNGSIICCLDDDMDGKTALKIAQFKKKYGIKKMRVVFKDSIFENGVLKTNIFAILKQNGIDEVVSI